MKLQPILTITGALASVAGPCAQQAQAQSLEIYGLIGAYYGNVKRSGDVAATRQVGPGGLNTSFLGFRGSENLGHGVKAIFALESFFRPDTGEQGRNPTDPLFSRNSYVGIEGGIGRLTLGRQTNPTYTAMIQLSPFGNSVVFSPLTLQTFVAAYGSNILGDTVWNNVVQYATPEMDGVHASLLYAPGEVAGRPGVSNIGLHGTLKRGKLYAAVSAQRVRVNVSTPLPAGQDAWLAGATYDFGLVRLYGNVERTYIDGGPHTRLFDAGLSVPLSKAGALWIESAHTRIERRGAPNRRRTTSSIGYDHRLSKRTDVYAIYSNDKRSDADAAGTTALGIRHLF